MAGITDMPFRLLAKKAGAGLVCGEMASAKALEIGSARTRRMIAVHPDEHPVSMQIFGADAFAMGLAARKVQDAGADIVDINLGCPVRKITKAGAGIALACSVKWIEVVRAVVHATTIPVTIKIRVGLTADEMSAPEIAHIAESEGVRAVIIHGRPASLFHSGPVFFAPIAGAVQNVKIPVIANGGIYDGPSAKKMFDQTGCAAVMVGRAVMGDFDVLRRIQDFLSEGRMDPDPAPRQRIQNLLEHLAFNRDFYGEENGIKRLRKVMPAYIKGFPDAAMMRHELMTLTAIADIRRYLDSVIS
jgi:nifR3 family TIM-barrel protein